MGLARGRRSSEGTARSVYAEGTTGIGGSGEKARAALSLSWSIMVGAEAFEPRPSAPKFDLQRTINNLTGAGWHRKSRKRAVRNTWCGAKVGLRKTPGISHSTRWFSSRAPLEPTPNVATICATSLHRILPQSRLLVHESIIVLRCQKDYEIFPGFRLIPMRARRVRISFSCDWTQKDPSFAFFRR